ncbi:MAG: carbamate kinase, partial [Candidatus Heimdallarchaeota archaeon]|nr:carbamate kinase [Candidatus Heimdallarchaeota archaeon]
MISDAANKNESFEQQLANVRKSTNTLLDIVEAGHQIIVTHGNGPQVGSFLVQQEANVNGSTNLPLKVLTAATQGQIGVMLQHSLINEIRARGLSYNVFIVPTTVIVDKGDPAFTDPTKPVGSFYSDEEYESLGKGTSTFKKLAQGWRKVVPSPIPLKILEDKLIQQLSEEGNLVISVGGGGSPTVQDENNILSLIDAVIDKDLASSVLASKIEADMLLILTNVEGIFENFNQENSNLLNKLSLTNAQTMISNGNLGRGS